MAYLLNGPKSSAGLQVARMFENDSVKGQELVHEVCDHLFDPEKPYLKSRDCLEWIKVLFGADIGFEAICSKIREFDSSSLCGCVWTAHFIAYRCRTCATSPCMSLCAACFENGRHEGHDYNIFRSEAGGACDCGDSKVMHSSGFCSHHGPNRVIPPSPPEGFLAAGKVLLDRMFLLVIQYLRQISLNYEPESELPPIFCNHLNFLLELIKLGSLIRSHVTRLLLDEHLYSNLKECKGYKCLEDVNSSLHTYHKQTKLLFDKAQESLSRPLSMSWIQDTGQFERSYKYKNYLDEITFWIVKYSFPEPLILVVLNLLPDGDMKREFSKCFSRHYSRIAESLIQADDLDRLSNRVVHISVQLFSNDDLAYMLCTEENLLQIFMISIHNIISPSLVRSTTHHGDLHYCVSCTSRLIHSNVYWPVVSDLVNVLSHTNVAKLFLRDADLVQCWFQELIAFCGMTLNKRALDAHIEFEPDSNLSLVAFYTEREACASTLWCLLLVLQDLNSVEVSYNTVRSLLTALQDLFDALGVSESSPLQYNQVSFHYPLHRYLAHFISNAIMNQGATVLSFSITEPTARTIIMHPLQVLIATFEVQSALWVRNGLHMATQSLAHRQHFFSKFFIDADLYLVQFCVCILPPHYVIALLLQRCRVLSCLTLSEIPLIRRWVYPNDGEKGEPNEEKLYKMFESVFIILQYIIAINTLKDKSEDEVIRDEMIALLTIKPSPYSSLHDHIPQSHESHTSLKSIDYVKTLQLILAKFAHRKEGEGMEQTKYVPNHEAWKLYNPLFTHYRALYQRDVQKAHCNYVQYLQNSNKIALSLSETDLWPPYQPISHLPSKYQALAGLVQSRLLHGLIFIVLHNNNIVTDTTISVALHLLDSALRLPLDSESEIRQEIHDQAWCGPIINLFDSDNIFNNIMKIISFQSDSNSENNEQRGKIIYTGESIISLLIKLYDKFNDRKGSFVLNAKPSPNAPLFPPTRLNVISNILHLAASLSSEIEQMIRVICKSLAPQSSVSDPQISSLNTALDARERRKQKAKEAQERLMKQFMKKQKEFLESSENMAVDSNVTDVDSTSPSLNENIVNPRDWGLKTFSQYECVICGMSEQELHLNNVSDEQGREKIMGVVCLAQPSYVLGMSTHDGQRMSPYKPGTSHLIVRPNTRRLFVLKQFQSFSSLFDANIFKKLDLYEEQNLFATAVGTHVSTCGHCVHLSCHSKYVDSVRNQGRSQLGYDMIRAFRCPLCRQVSNFVIPCNVRMKQKSVSDECLHRNVISKAWLDTLSDLTCVNETDTLGAIIAQSSRSLGLSIPLAALVRHNVEILAMLIDNDLSRSRDIPGPSRSGTLIRKCPMASLFVLLHWMWKVGDAKDIRDKHSASAKKIRSRLHGEGELEFSDVPLLLQDPVTILIQLILDVPLLPDEFQRCVRVVYNLAFVQALIGVCFKFSPDERRAWSNVSLETFSSEKLEDLVASVLYFLPEQIFNQTSSNQSSRTFEDTFTTTVFTLQCVYNELMKSLTHFTRVASILQQYIFPQLEPPVITSMENEFENRAAYIGLLNLQQDCPSTIPSVLRCLSWSDAKSLVATWCSKIMNIAERDATKRLLNFQSIWKIPRLIDLPNDYNTLFQMYRLKPCSACGVVPKEPALCLVCGEYFCSKSQCDGKRDHDGNILLTYIPPQSLGSTRDLYAGSRHARQCGAGTTVLLHINTSSIVVIRGSRLCTWGSVYLDAHGEEDRGWRRGKPLFLKRERFELLEQQWLNHIFDNTAKDWTPHRNYF